MKFAIHKPVPLKDIVVEVLAGTRSDKSGQRATSSQIQTAVMVDLLAAAKHWGANCKHRQVPPISQPSTLLWPAIQDFK
jgi:hypothetical protein